MLNLKLFVILWYKPPFLENSLCKSAFAETMLDNKQLRNLSGLQKHFFFVHGSVGLATVAVFPDAGQTQVCSCGFHFGVQQTFNLQESHPCASKATHAYCLEGRFLFVCLLIKYGKEVSCKSGCRGMRQEDTTQGDP